MSNLVGALAASYAKPGDVLFYQEEVASDLYFLVTGKVNLFATFSVRVPRVAEKRWWSVSCLSQSVHIIQGGRLLEACPVGFMFFSALIGQFTFEKEA